MWGAYAPNLENPGEGGAGLGLSRGCQLFVGTSNTLAQHSPLGIPLIQTVIWRLKPRPTTLGQLGSPMFRQRVQMQSDEAQAFSGGYRENHSVSKRSASEEPNTAPDAKRIKILHDGRPKPAAGPPATPQRIPFLDKVCCRPRNRKNSSPSLQL